jgi:hypothetical protein
VIKSGIGVVNKSFYQGFRDARLGALKRKRSSLERMVGVYDDALSEFKQQRNNTSGSYTPWAEGNSSRDGLAPGEDVIDRLLELGAKISEPELRKTLIEEKIKLSKDLQLVITDIEFYDGDKLRLKEQNISTAELSNLISESTAELQTIHSAILGIINVSNSGVLNDKGELFDYVGSVTPNSSNWLPARLQLKLALAFILGCTMGVMVVFVRRIFTSA